ncbi:hypothetical protein BAL199_01384 [alpha proteobacterium BAL199]|jgi:hypothetical protein|nr:hypothetical protein BAL199_01384 [alpha proteobacterium BAL199]
MTETEAWMPSLSNPPEFAGPLLSGLRRVLPAMFDAALQAPEHPTKPFSATMDVTDDPSAGLTVVGSDLQRDDYGPRDALFLSFHGEAKFKHGELRVTGDAVLDLATNAILRLRLSEPAAL